MAAVKDSKLAFHEAANLFPMMTDAELQELAEDIKAHGQREPIYLHEGKIIDGRNRYLACKHAGVTPRFREWNGKGSLIAFVVSENVRRRHLTTGHKVAIAVDMLPLLEAEAAKQQREAGKKGAVHGKEGGRGRRKPLRQKVAQGVSDKRKAAEKAAKATGTNRKYVADGKKLKEEDPEEFERMKSGKTTLAAVNRKRKETTREKRRQENRVKVADVPAAEVVTSGAKFATIMIDPPWDWGDEGDVNQMGRAKPDFATMSIERLLDLPVGDMADVDCHLYLWITNRSLPKGFALLERWGFRYITALTWVKPSCGMGNYYRGQTEHVLFAVKGSQMLKRHDVGTVFYADRGRRHSEKPKEFYSLVESCSPGPYLEMFSRSERPDWVAWGEADATK